MRIAIDIMGGDNAPDEILKGAIQGLELMNDDDQLILVGDQQVIEEDLIESGVKDEPRIQIVGTTQVVTMDEPPVEAIRNKPDSSLAKLAWLGSRKCPEPADIVISAGNTGGLVAAAQMTMRRLPGVLRPGLAVTIPTFYGPVVLCDVGANIEPKPAHLHQYGHMAGIYAETILGKANPKVGLMSVGSEEGKGTGLTKESAKLMRNDEQLNYVGYVEGRDIFNGHADIVITEGFVGNVVLKLAEGLASGLFKTIAHEIFEIDPELAMKFEPVVKRIYSKHDYHDFGGAPLLGARGICVICHGSSEARTIKSAVRNSIQYVEKQINHKIVERFAKVDPKAATDEKVKA